MDAVWPITAMYLGPAGMWGYLRLVRPRSRKPADAARYQPGREAAHGAAEPAWHGGALSASHCGAGCVRGDIVGGWLVFATAWQVAGERLYAEYIAELVLAWIFGIAFQYLSIKPARPGITARRALAGAIKADTLSILAFEVGMFAWMALAALAMFGGPVPIHGPVFWFMMQIGLILGFVTTYPVNR